MLAQTQQSPSALAMRIRHHGPSAPPGQWLAGRYEVRFATARPDREQVRSVRDAASAQGVVGRPASVGLDVLDDAIRDAFVHHVLVRRALDHVPVAAARITAGADLHELSRSRASHFDLEALPASHLDRAAWLDRITVDPDEVDQGVMWHLLSGVHRYLDWNDLRYMLSPAMVASHEPNVVAAASLVLARCGSAGHRWSAPSKLDYVPEWTSAPVPAGDARFSPWLSLLSHLGARVCGGPAVDAQRAVSLFLMRLDLREVAPQVRDALPGPGCWEARPKGD